MADNNAPAAAGSENKSSGAQDEGSGSKSDDNAAAGGDKSAKTVEQLEATIAELVADRNNWKGKARQFEREKSEKDKEATNKSGDVEAIKASYTKEIETLQGTIKTLTDQLHHEVALGALRRAADGKVYKVSQIEALLGNKITVHDENGVLMPAVKNDKGDGILYDAGKPMAVEKFLENFLALEENANLALSGRKGGTGASGSNGKGSATDGRIPTIDELNAMPDKGAAWMKANPDKLAKVDISSIHLKG